MSGFRNQPKILRGAFVEYGLSLPPLFVVFQFNPVQLSRSRSLAFNVPGADLQSPPCPPCPPPVGEGCRPREKPPATAARPAQRQRQSLRQFHQREFDGDDLMAIREKQLVTVEEESISFELRLDATDDLDDGDTISEQFGILPRLSTLELMMYPKEESLLGQAADALLGLDKKGFSFTKKPNPPLVLFIWGRTRVLPVNIESMSITETEFDTTLNPIRATVEVRLKVIEGKSVPYLYSKAVKEAMSVLNLANITEIANVVIPG